MKKILILGNLGRETLPRSKKMENFGLKIFRHYPNLEEIQGKNFNSNECDWRGNVFEKDFCRKNGKM